jgi:hypothetical protein
MNTLLLTERTLDNIRLSKLRLIFPHNKTHPNKSSKLNEIPDRKFYELNLIQHRARSCKSVSVLVSGAYLRLN